MKKIMFYIPAILFTAFYSFAIIAVGVFSVSPIVYVWIVLFAVSGVLLSKGLPWGGFFGVLPGIHMIYMGTIDTGQIINESRIGIAVSILYLLCCGIVFHKNRKASNQN